MLLLNEITVKNFLSHSETNIKFKKDTKILINGVSGSGKTGIVEGILFALYGRARVDNRNLVRKGAKSATVSLKLSDGNKQYLITRSVSNKGKNELAVTQSIDGGHFVHIDKTGIKDIQNWITDVLLHASFELFTNSIAYPQDSSGNFVKATASERKDLLLEIIRAGDLDIYYEKARAALITEETNSTVLLSKIEGLEKNIKDFEPMAVRVDEFQKEVEKYSLESAGLVTSEKKIEEELNNNKIIEIQLKNQELRSSKLVSDIASKTVDVNKKKDKIQQNLSIDITTAKQNVEKAKIVFEEISTIEKKLKLAAETQSKINIYLANKPTFYDYTKDIESLNKQLIPLIKDSGKCPAGDKCPFTVPIRGQINFLQEQIVEKTKKMEDGKAAQDKWSTEFILLPKAEDTTEDYKKYGELKESYRQLSSYESIVLKHELSLKENEELNAQIEELKKLIANELLESQIVEKEIAALRLQMASFNIVNLNNELERIKVAIVDLKTKESEAIRQHTIAVQASSNVLEARKSLVALQKDASDIKERLECLKLIKEAFGSKGVKAVVVDYLIPQLEERINELLGQLSDFKIRLDTQQTKADEEGVKEGLWITVINDMGEELSFDNFSGGEKIKISMAISEALSSLQNSIGFRILDEAINSLDSESTENFVEVLIKLQDKFPQVIVISHLPEVQDLFEEKITITKINGVSKIT